MLRTTESPAHTWLRDPDLLQATSASLSDALALSDEHGVVLAVNAAYSRLYGFADAEVVGNSFAIIFPEPARGAAESAYRHVFHDAAPPVHRTTIRRADGVDRHVEARIAFVERAERRVAMLSVIHEIAPVNAAPRAVRSVPTLDLDSLACLCDTHVRSALGYVQSLVRDAGQAERLVEDALLAIWRAGVTSGHDDASTQLLLFSVLRREAGELREGRLHALRARRDVPPQPAVNRWWAGLQR